MLTADEKLQMSHSKLSSSAVVTDNKGVKDGITTTTTVLQALHRSSRVSRQP